MVSMRITTLDLGIGVGHTSTDWQVSTSRLFEPENIVVSSIEDTINLTHIEFNEILDPTINYYGRARELLSTGYTMWGNVDMFTPKDINDLEIDTDIPTKVGPPVIASSSASSNHALSIFTLYATGFSVIGSADHQDTSWFIEDINSKLIWSSVRDSFNKSSIHINRILLDTDKIYRIRAVFHTSSEDSSQVATKTILTAGSRYITLLTSLNNLNVVDDTVLVVNSQPGLLHTEWQLYSLEDNDSDIVWDTVVTSGDLTTATIPANTLKSQSRYMLKIKSNLSDNWYYINFSTY